jgi:hypothetical protein
MSSTYSTNLAIELIGAGEQAGNWGSTTNTNLGTLIEQAISGYVTQAVATGTDTTITIPNGATGVARNMFIELTGTGGTNTNLIVPANKKLYYIYNNTASGQVTVKVSGQTGISVANGAKVVLVSNGTDIVNATTYLSTSGIVPVTSGGTGVATLTGLAYGNGTSAFTAATGPQISTALGATAVTNATNATNATNLTSTLGVSGGGTGVTTLTGVAYGNGTGAFTAATSGQLVTALGTLAIANGGTGQTTAAAAGSALGAVGVGQSWQSPSRSNGVTYTNSTGRPINVVISASLSPSGASYFYINGAQVGYTSNAFADRGVGWTNYSAIIPDGNTYQVSVSGSIATWYELR